MLPSRGSSNRQPAARSSQSRMSAVCITITNVAPPDRRLGAIAQAGHTRRLTLVPQQRVWLSTETRSLAFEVLELPVGDLDNTRSEAPHGADGVSGTDTPVLVRPVRGRTSGDAGYACRRSIRPRRDPRCRAVERHLHPRSCSHSPSRSARRHAHVDDLRRHDHDVVRDQPRDLSARSSPLPQDGETGGRIDGIRLWGKTHWGKIMALDGEEVARLYTALPQFRAHGAAVDPYRVFVNDFVRDALGV